ncbi:Twin-arginine translocation protein TatA [hydrothermal vent metagenome]|uniref:Twin-arginine translocation protein TatA n=1 Tax=hydrothermal vent metagenome TaxID=652676 RepID=A0A3B1BQT6_9ZZZZ
MFGIGMPELIIILVILLIVFGASRLPEIGSGLGRGIKNFKKSVTDTEKELKSVADSAEGDKDKDSVG